MINANVIIGRYKGEEVTLNQWTNDWFGTSDGRIFTDHMLSFNPEDVDIIRKEKNTGFMFLRYKFIVKNGRAYLRKKQR
jgi:hypothetical protein